MTTYLFYYLLLFWPGRYREDITRVQDVILFLQSRNFHAHALPDFISSIIYENDKKNPLTYKWENLLNFCFVEISPNASFPALIANFLLGQPN
jgi:hypothetical protein